MSKKTSEEIQEELLDLIGFHNIELLTNLIERREFIKDHCKRLQDELKNEKGVVKQNEVAQYQRVGVTVEYGGKKGRGKK